MAAIREHVGPAPTATLVERDRSGTDLREIVDQAAAGAPAAWDELVGRFGNMVRAVARSCRLHDADVAEVYQVTWLRLVENIGRIEQPERVGAWLATTAKRESLRIVRARERTIPDNDLLERRPDNRLAPPDNGPITQERSEAVLRALSMLPARCQGLLGLLTSDEPPSYKEIATMLAMPIGSIGPTRGRCLEQLRRILAEMGVEA